MTKIEQTEVDRAQAQRVALLEAIFDVSGQNVYQTILLDEAAKDAGIEGFDSMWAAASYLSNKGLIDADGGGFTARITVSGIDLVEGWRLPRRTQENTTTNAPTNFFLNHATVTGGIQFQSPNSTQTVSISITKFDESVEKLARLVGQCPASELDKEEAVAALERLRQLSKKDTSEEVVTRAKDKLEIVKGVLETAKGISEIAAPYLGMLSAHFFGQGLS
jgi:hypothetical protein